MTTYLIKQVMLSKEQRMEALREFIPNAKSEDWDLLVAGQRVQIIKDTAAGKGTLQFGTEVISAADGSIAALLGASPGASTAVSVMLEVIKKMLPAAFKNVGAENKGNDSFLWRVTIEKPGTYSRNSYFNSTDAWIKRKLAVTGKQPEPYHK